MGSSQDLAGCYKFIKYAMVVFNFIVLVIGGAVLGLGIFTLVSDFGVSNMVAILGSDLYKAGVYLLIAGGAITVVISFLGCCGACTENRCLLGLYFAVMLILSIFFIVVCIIGFVFKSNVTGHLKREAEAMLINHYGSDNDVTERWDRIQQELKCCGMVGDVNSTTSWAIYKLQSQWFHKQDQGSNSGLGVQYVPFSCCKPDSNLEVCVGRQNANNQPPKMGPPVFGSMTTNDGLYGEGCYDKLDDFLDTNALIIGGIALGAFVIMLFGMIFSICLCKQIGRQGYVV